MREAKSGPQKWRPCSGTAGARRSGPPSPLHTTRTLEGRRRRSCYGSQADSRRSCTSHPGCAICGVQAR
eukprot:9405328-Lingulodinium_polyedra.AAC.1